jgi:hypothetical protein
MPSNSERGGQLVFKEEMKGFILNIVYFNWVVLSYPHKNFAKVGPKLRKIWFYMELMEKGPIVLQKGGVSHEKQREGHTEFMGRGYC